MEDRSSAEVSGMDSGGDSSIEYSGVDSKPF